MDGAKQRERTRPHVAAGEVVAHVEHTNLGGDPRDHPMYDPDELVGTTEVGEKRDGQRHAPETRATGVGADRRLCAPRRLASPCPSYQTAPLRISAPPYGAVCVSLAS